MELERYALYKDPDNFEYEFYSEGPEGRIRKIVRFQYLKDLGHQTFNLAFGDWNEATQSLDDQATSNNNDRTKVLATVANAFIDFIEFHPNAIVLAQGSSITRTRLYQMEISANWLTISINFEVYGNLNGDWQPFKKGINYKAFLIFKKRTKFE